MQSGIFRKLLLHWYSLHKRELPWRDICDPYRIWISEIILQQTRIAQGLDYYERFLTRFPDVQSLAAAAEDEVLKLVICMPPLAKLLWPALFRRPTKE